MPLGAEFVPAQQIAFGHDADQRARGIDHEQTRDAVPQHQIRCVLHRFIGTDREDFSGHYIRNYHSNLRQPAANFASRRTCERIPWWKQRCSNFSLGLWIWSSSRPKPISSVSIPRTFFSETTTGMDPPQPISIAGLPYSSAKAVCAARTHGESALTSTPGEPWPPSNSAVAPTGNRSVTNCLNCSTTSSGSWPGTRRNVTF